VIFDSSVLNTILIVLGAFIAVAGAIGSLANFIIDIKKNPHKWKIVGPTALLVLVGVGILWYAINATIQADEWTLLLQDAAPSCDPSNGVWITPDKVVPLTYVQCPTGALLMTAPPNRIPAEVDLERVKGQTYSQAKLDAQVTLIFSRGIQEDYHTMAGLLVQTPQQGIGGYGLWINSTGYWELRDGSGHLKANGRETPSANFILELKVFQGQLYGSINNKQVFVYSDPLNPSSGAIALIANGNISGSTILFDNFKLSA
jgi:hypothetical protein